MPRGLKIGIDSPTDQTWPGELYFLLRVETIWKQGRLLEVFPVLVSTQLQLSQATPHTYKHTKYKTSQVYKCIPLNITEPKMRQLAKSTLQTQCRNADFTGDMHSTNVGKHHKCLAWETLNILLLNNPLSRLLIWRKWIFVYFH